MSMLIHSDYLSDVCNHIKPAWTRLLWKSYLLAHVSEFFNSMSDSEQTELTDAFRFSGRAPVTNVTVYPEVTCHIKVTIV